MAGMKLPNALLQLLAFITLALCSPRAVVTPFAAPALVARQDQDIAVTCGYLEAQILSPVGCFAGSTCAADPTQNLAGLCCRLGDNANCVGATSCVASADLSASCTGDCSANSAITKCSDAASPYCYTRYWVSAGSTPVEIGCTTTQGYSDYVYTTYTVRGGTANFDPVTTPPPSTTQVGTGATSSSTSSGGSAESESSSSDSDSGSSGNSSGSGDSTPVGAIAGGVVGGVVGLGLVAAVIVWIVLRHRRQSREAAWNQGGGHPGAGAPASEKPPKSANQATSPVSPIQATEAAKQPGVNQRFEIAQNDRTHELHSGNRVPELP